MKTLFKEWQEQHIQPKPAKERKPKPPKPARYPISPVQSIWLKAIAPLRYGVGSPDKRFARDIQHEEKLTIGQGEYLAHIVYKYRKQLGLQDEIAKETQKLLLRDARQERAVTP